MSLENIVVLGSATIDVRLPQGVETVTLDDRVIIRSASGELVVPVIDGPIEQESGKKYTALEPIGEKIKQFSPELKFGGGGYNSLMEILSLMGDNLRLFQTIYGSNGIRLKNIKDIVDALFNVYYIDMSASPKLKQELCNMDVIPFLAGNRSISQNLVLNSRQDKVIIKSPIEYMSACFTDYDEAVVTSILRSCAGILVNSIKDEFLANLVSEYSNGKRLVSVVTNSLPATIALERLVQRGIAIFNYDEFGNFLEKLGFSHFGSDADENEKIDYAINGVAALRYYTPHPLFVTLGKNGALCSQNNTIYHVKLKPEISEKVQETIEKQNETTCGAGDCFAGAVFYYLMTNLNLDIISAGIEGCKRAVRYLGYQELLSPNDFIVIPQKPFFGKSSLKLLSVPLKHPN